MQTNERDPVAVMRVAAMAIADARKAWRANDGSVPAMRKAYRFCLLAARCARKAAAIAPDAITWEQLSTDAENLTRAAAEILPKLIAE